MPWTTKRRHECYPVAKTDTNFRVSDASLLLLVFITVLSLLTVIHAPRAHADEIPQLDVAWIPTAHGSAQPTTAWSEFCERSPDECAINPAEPATIKLDKEVWNSIAKINKQVNAAVSPQEDLDHWGVVDRWDYPDDGYGDCEDYQILKRRLLVEAGLPRRALRMVVVLDELGQGHAVLAARTDQGDFILNNKKDQVLLWHRTGYVYIKSEGDTSHAWVRLGNQSRRDISSQPVIKLPTPTSVPEIADQILRRGGLSKTPARRQQGPPQRRQIPSSRSWPSDGVSAAPMPWP